VARFAQGETGRVSWRESFVSGWGVDSLGGMVCSSQKKEGQTQLVLLPEKGERPSQDPPYKKIGGSLTNEVGSRFERIQRTMSHLCQKKKDSGEKIVLGNPSSCCKNSGENRITSKKSAGATGEKGRGGGKHLKLYGENERKKMGKRERSTG